MEPSNCLLNNRSGFVSLLEHQRKEPVAKCSFQTRAGNLCVKKVSENRRLDGSH